MLSLLPALILLFWHGPTQLDRLAVSGRLPSGADTINRNIAGAELEALSIGGDHAFATLLGSHAGNHLRRAFWAFLCLDQPQKETQAETGHEEPSAFYPPQPAHKPEDGFARSQRTRDGPSFSGSDI